MKRILSVLTVGWVLLAAGEGWAAEKVIWNQKMKELYQTLSDLLVDITSDQNFNSPKNHSRIENNAKKLSKLAHGLNQAKSTADPDPSVKIISKLFSSEAERAYYELKRGNRPYARSILQSISGYCFACHSRSSSGPNFQDLPAIKKISKLSVIEQAKYHAATRQFDKALDEFESIIADPQATQARLLEWETAVRYSLAIAVRVKRDPDRALRIMERVRTAPRAPHFLKSHASQWSESIKKWKNEGERIPQTEEGLYAEVMRLINEAHKLQRYPADRGADILYLRATAAIHDLLRVVPNTKHMGEAFLMAGLSYEALRDLNISELHEIYYEACIRQAPHTEIAQSCYHRYEETTFEGYTGSGGTSLPSDVKMRLSELEKLAGPSAAEPPR